MGGIMRGTSSRRSRSPRILTRRLARAQAAGIPTAMLITMLNPAIMRVFARSEGRSAAFDANVNHLSVHVSGSHRPPNQPLPVAMTTIAASGANMLTVNAAYTPYPNNALFAPRGLRDASRDRTRLRVSHAWPRRNRGHDLSPSDESGRPAGSRTQAIPQARPRP